MVNKSGEEAVNKLLYKSHLSIIKEVRNNPNILVDEVTAALDAETAYQVSNSILNLSDVTCIVVTHSLEEGLLKQYDEKIILKSGNIVEKGNFNELINNKGYFYSLFTMSQ